MKLNIKTKILLNGVLSVVISIMLVTIIVSLFLWDQSEKRARQQIRHSIKVIDLEMQKMEAYLMEIAVKIGNQQEYASKANFIQKNRDNKALADMLEGERRELTISLYEATLTSRVPMLVLHSTEGNWMCSVSLKKNQVRLSYPSDQDKGTIWETVVFPGNPPQSEQWQKKTGVGRILHRHPLPLPSEPVKERQSFENHLWLTASSPLRAQILNPETLKEESVQKGLIEVSRDMDDSFILSLCNLTDTRINFFLGTRLNVGTLPSYNSLDQFAKKTGFFQKTLHAQGIIYKELHTDEGDFFEGLVPVLAEGRAIGAFSVLLSQEETRKAQWRMIWSLLVLALICILIVTPLTWFMAIRDIIERERMQKELAMHRDHLEVLVEERTAELDQKNIRLNETLKEVEKANTEIMDSIQYARTIQNSLLADLGSIKPHLPDCFFICIPCEIVSGDIFYTDVFEDGLIVAVIDCTGHGVPGAFMTMLAFSAMRRITRTEKYHDPSEILRQMNYAIQKTLQQDTQYALSDDGMDAAICFVSRQEPAVGDESSDTAGRRQLTFAGAKINLTHIHNGELSVIKGDRQSLGYKNSDLNFKFTNHTIDIEKEMSFYMSTDGFTDQLGGKKGLRFGTRRLKNLLKKNNKLSFEEQRISVLQAFNEYKGENEMQDDVTVVGFGFQKKPQGYPNK